MTVKSYNTVAQKAKRKTSMYLTTDEKRKLIQSCGESGFVLMDFYFSRAGIPNYVFTDEKAAKALGWSERKAQAVRLKLTKAGYYKQAVATFTDGDKIVTTFLGKIAVRTKSIMRAHLSRPKEFA